MVNLEFFERKIKRCRKYIWIEFSNRMTKFSAKEKENNETTLAYFKNTIKFLDSVMKFLDRVTVSSRHFNEILFRNFFNTWQYNAAGREDG